MNNTTPTLEEMKAIAREILRLNIEMIPSDAALKEVYQSVDQLIEATYATAKREALREMREWGNSFPGKSAVDMRGREFIDVTDLNNHITHLESELNSGAESK